MVESPACILVIDDDPVIAQELRLVCGALLPGARIIGAACGADAAHQMDRCDFDLIVLDLVLGNETGSDLLPELRARSPLTPIVIMSMHDSAPMRYVCKQHGATGFEAKPSDAAGYSALVTRLGAHIATGSVTMRRAIN